MTSLPQGLESFGYQFAWAAAHIGFMPDCGEWGFWSSGGARSGLLTDRGCACGRKIGIAPDRHWHDSDGECHTLEHCAMAIEAGSSNEVGPPPCDHDSLTPCPPVCADAKEAWRRRAAAAIVAQQHSVTSKQSRFAPQISRRWCDGVLADFVVVEQYLALRADWERLRAALVTIASRDVVDAADVAHRALQAETSG